jgi:uncharacterized membrane protein
MLPNWRLFEKIKTFIHRSSNWKIALTLISGTLLTLWLIETPAGLLGKADAIGYAVCHRIDTRSFHLGERQIPVCARCTGQYLGAVLGLVYQLAVGRRKAGRPPRGVIVVIGFLCLAYAVDGLNSYVHLIPQLSRFYLYEPSNLLRVVTGTGLGIGISMALLPAFHQTVWRQWDRRPALDGFISLGGLLLLAAIVDILVLTENPLILYPLALVSASGILILLTMVYTMVWLMVLKAENRYDKIHQLVYPLMAGFTIALLQIAMLDLVRFLFTGNWGGFHFG